MKAVVRKPAKHISRYAPDPTAKEYQTFPRGYRLENGLWPAVAIIKVEGVGGREEDYRYLIQWKPHPYTMECFRPTWVGHGDVTPALLASWEEQHGHSIKTLTIADEKDEDGSTNSDHVVTVSDSQIQCQVLARSITAFKHGQGDQYAQDDITVTAKRRRILRVIPDSPSDIEEDKRMQDSDHKEQNFGKHLSSQALSVSKMRLRTEKTYQKRFRASNMPKMSVRPLEVSQPQHSEEDGTVFRERKNRSQARKAPASKIQIYGACKNYKELGIEFEELGNLDMLDPLQALAAHIFLRIRR